MAKHRDEQKWCAPGMGNNLVLVLVVGKLIGIPFIMLFNIRIIYIILLNLKISF